MHAVQHKIFQMKILLKRRMLVKIKENFIVKYGMNIRIDNII